MEPETMNSLSHQAYFSIIDKFTTGGGGWCDDEV